MPWSSALAAAAGSTAAAWWAPGKEGSSQCPRTARLSAPRHGNGATGGPRTAASALFISARRPLGCGAASPVADSTGVAAARTRHRRLARRGSATVGVVRDALHSMAALMAGGRRSCEGSFCTRSSATWRGTCDAARRHGVRCPHARRRGVQMRTRRSGAQGGGGTVFVTVGTTSFDPLIAAVDDPAFVAAARAKGYTSLVIQARAVRALPCWVLVFSASVTVSRSRCLTGAFPVPRCSTTHLQLGRGSYLPTRVVPPGESSSSLDGFSVRCGGPQCCLPCVAPPAVASLTSAA